MSQICRSLFAVFIFSFVATPLFAQQRSYNRLVTSNGFAVASFDRVSGKFDTFLEHPYRFAEPNNAPQDLCYTANETRDLAFDTYFGIRVGGIGDAGEWLGERPVNDARYLPGTNIIEVTQFVGPNGGIEVKTYGFTPMGVNQPAMILLARIENQTGADQDISAYGLFNFRLGLANGGRDPGPDNEESSYNPLNKTFYEFGPDQGTIAYTWLTDVFRVTTSTGGNSIYNALVAGNDLDDNQATGGPTNDIAPGFQAPVETLADGATTWVGAQIVWALDEDAEPDVTEVLSYVNSRAPEQILNDEVAAWDAWHTEPPASVPAAQTDLWKQQAAFLRMGQVREPGPGFGQILASLPPGLGDPNNTWNIAWVRDMAYAVAALARSGHLQEALDAILFQLTAPRGLHETEVGMPYRISITRYFGNGQEESDCNENGPNIEFDGFGLFLWTVGEYLRAGGDVENLREHWDVLKNEIADVLVSLVDPSGVIKADSSIWEVHWNGQERRFAYTSLAAVRGLCDAADLARTLGEDETATAWETSATGIRDAILDRMRDGTGAIGQSAEDILAGTNYVDAAALEAINWGVIAPNGNTAKATADLVLDTLTVPNQVGLRRNDDGGWYDSQEWVFIDLRAVNALRLTHPTRAQEILDWTVANANVNDLQFAELHGEQDNAYLGSIPMVGFGAGTYILATSGEISPPACGAYPADDPGMNTDMGGVDDVGVGDDMGGDMAGDPVCIGECAPEKGCCATMHSKTTGTGALLFCLLGFVAYRRRRKVALLIATSAFLFSCAQEQPPAPDFNAAQNNTNNNTNNVINPNFDGVCPTTLTYRTTATNPRVWVAGDWNEFDETVDQMEASDGGFSITIDLEPGLHAYKFYVEGDNQEPWRLDPENAYRTYRGDVENSGLRVYDCSRPKIESNGSLPDGTTFNATIDYVRGFAGPAQSAVVEKRDGSDWQTLDLEPTIEGDEIRFSLDGLDAGKHTVRVTAMDEIGLISDPLVMPFWISDDFEWSDATIYMVMTDRFRDGDPSNNDPNTEASPGAGWMGGDLIGVTDAIREGYFDQIGVNAIWLTPFNTNPEGVYSDQDEFHLVAGYHGYWPTEPREVDPRLGSEEALHELVEVAHENGIRILMDLVLNHVHEDHPYATSTASWFNEGCICGTADCDWTVRRLDCLFRPYMPDVNWQSQEAAERFVDDSLWWMETFDLDGFRVDAVKHVADGAVFNLGIRVRESFDTAGTHHFLMGETAMGWDGSSGPTEGGNPENYGTIARYVGPDALDGQFDFVLYYAGALQFLNDNVGFGMAHIDFWTQASMQQYPQGSVMTPYIGSHDTSRFLSLAGTPNEANNKWDNLPQPPADSLAYDRMYTAFAWLFAIPGAPLLYYGDEYGEYGGADPDNRHMMRFEGDRTPIEQAQFDRVTRLVRSRRDLPGLRSTAYRSLLATETLWGVARGDGDETVIVIVNAGPNQETTQIPVPAEVLPNGSSLEDALGGPGLSIQGGVIDVTIDARSAIYLHLP